MDKQAVNRALEEWRRWRLGPPAVDLGYGKSAAAKCVDHVGGDASTVAVVKRRVQAEDWEKPRFLETHFHFGGIAHHGSRKGLRKDDSPASVLIVDTAVGDMPKHHRKAIVYKILMGYSLREGARQMHIDPSMFRRHLENGKIFIWARLTAHP